MTSATTTFICNTDNCSLVSSISCMMYRASSLLFMQSNRSGHQRYTHTQIQPNDDWYILISSCRCSVILGNDLSFQFDKFKIECKWFIEIQINLCAAHSWFLICVFLIWVCCVCIIIYIIIVVIVVVVVVEIFLCNSFFFIQRRRKVMFSLESSEIYSHSFGHRKYRTDNLTLNSEQKKTRWNTLISKSERTVSASITVFAVSVSIKKNSEWT